VVTFRLATTTDDDALVSLILALYCEDSSPDGPTSASARAALAALRETPTWGHAIVMEELGTIAGYALLISFYSNELRGRVCVIDEMYVSKEFRGRGFGGTLLRTLAQRRLPVFRDAVALELEVSPQNKRARALYEKEGFVPIRNTTMRKGLAESPP
jgi:GNAT superfamily N-acetyltransferase